ncbi:MAG: diguanylate cyclase [Lachnospiraceae bacterium]|nr:diguanylate cyclase [Lachnospiraceae bacterium]
MSRLRENGISHRIVHLWLVIIIVIFSSTVFFSALRLTNTFMRITADSERDEELQKAAQELMNASDYLTEQVQRFTMSGDVRFMDKYFTEAFESRRREDALATMEVDPRADAARTRLQEAMNSSVALMDQEYYAMRLTLEAQNATDYPDVLKDVQLSAEDAALSPEEKSRRAVELVLNDDYYVQKEEIRQAMQDSLAEVEKLAVDTEKAALASLKRNVRIACAAIFLQALLIFYLMWLITRVSINPVLNAVNCIREDMPIPENGSNEFKYLAGAYNKMYQKNKSSLAQLSFKASHDELTGAYNRAGYDYLLSTIDLKTTYMMLFDLDNFKQINDTYGHETGDKVLVKLVNILKMVFRDDDCICRIGGDEFVVFMVHSAGMRRKLIESKIDQINAELESTDDGLPPISISVGIMNGKDAADTENLFRKADAAMYESKKQGKHTYTFYTK